MFSDLEEGEGSFACFPRWPSAPFPSCPRPVPGAASADRRSADPAPGASLAAAALAAAASLLLPLAAGAARRRPPRSARAAGSAAEVQRRGALVLRSDRSTAQAHEAPDRVQARMPPPNVAPGRQQWETGMWCSGGRLRCRPRGTPSLALQGRSSLWC